MIFLLLIRALHLAIIHNHQDVVLQLLDVLPQLPPTETPVVDCLNNLKQVCVFSPHHVPHAQCIIYNTSTVQCCGFVRIIII